jgi:intracellular septation protein A
MQKIIGVHLLSFVTMTILLILISEFLLNTFVPEIHNVVMWLNLIVYGTIGILILTIISCLIFLRKNASKDK